MSGFARVHVLATPEAQAQGVIGRPGIAADEVFLFPDIDPAGTYFHMAGVPFAIEIAFLDGDLRVLSVERMEPGSGRAWPTPGTRHAAEAAPGALAAQGIRPGVVWEQLRRAAADEGGSGGP